MPSLPSTNSAEQSKVRTISNAFVLLGKQPINQLDTTNALHNAASNIYDLMVRVLLSDHPWNFAKKEVDLQLTTETSSNEDKWKYVFKLPSIPQILVIYGVYPKTDYDIFEDRLYSNQNELKLTYIYKVREDDFPTYFELAITYKTCSSLALAVTQNPAIVNEWSKQSQLQLVRARQLDSSQAPSVQIDPNNDIYSSFFT
ncbi:MAG: hypothetical protein ACTSR1_00255 [Candidatus Heimdallarchaeota archaeon]